MKTERGYIVAMHKLTNKIVTISLEMWDLIENRDDYKPLYRADDKKDAENYVKEISSNIQKEPAMVNKQEFIEKACEWLKFHISIPYEGGTTENGDTPAKEYLDWAKKRLEVAEEICNDFRKAMEE